VVVATHRNLESLVATGEFRRDLFHRVVVFPLELPPLRCRTEDLPALVNHFVLQVCAQNNWKPMPIFPDAVELLKQYSWPGNIRELRNVVERLLLLCESKIDAESVKLALPAISDRPAIAPIAVNAAEATGPLSERVLAFERTVVLAELERHDRHITQTAKVLGLERSHLYKKCQQLGIDLQSLPKHD
jgi:two-component system nitrogen regulation response regulator NtrX